jgi:threonine/homoserine/homoserine lactone efflux protein|tara:strand:- start:937 stop:1566 length:630 start_codon:yes stop_codon:yes gene_type:complete
MFEFNIQITNLIPALSFFILNVFIPGPNVLNTIATSMGSGRSSGISCALATGIGVILTALISLFGATMIFYKFPLIYKSLTMVGGILLIYFAKRYIQKALSSKQKLIAIKDIKINIAFRQAFLVLISNPKMMTTYLAVISLFPIVVSNAEYAIIFSLMAGTASFSGHLIFATIFSTRIASEIYMKLYRLINAFVGIGFIIYAIKLFLSL